MIPTSVRIGSTILVGLLLVGAVMVGRAGMMESRQPAVESADELRAPEGAAERLARAVQIRSISPQDYDEEELEPFRQLHAELLDWYPKTHEALRRSEVPPCSLVYRWEGTNPDLRPALWLSHLDVVPPESREEWTHPPFSGAVVDGHIWGRGTLDVKSGAIGILEATEALLQQGYRPERSVIYAFGCDEEVGGERGAKKIAGRLKARDVRPKYVLDEGHAITKGLVPGLDRPVALVGIAERGYMTLKLTARGEGGHSSMPPNSTAIGRLSRAVARLEDRPMPARLNEPTRRMFATLGPELPFHQRLVFANLWLLEPLVVGKLTAQPTTNATVRTTTAVTMVEGGTRENVLPGRATATVNFRIAPGDSIEKVQRHVKRVVGERVQVERPERDFQSNPSPVSSTKTEAFESVRRNVRAVFGEETAVAPALTVGATDSRYYDPIADDVYRFLPIVLGKGDTERIHGVDERVSVANYRRMVRFYMAMLKGT